MDYKKIISAFLITTMLASVLPMNVFAEKESMVNARQTESEVIKEEPKREAKIIGEVVEKREKNVKHFLKDDMSFDAVVYPYAVHYKEDGKWKDIDNTLEEKKDEDKKDVLENKANDFKVKLAKNAQAEKLVRIKKGDYEVSWNIEGAGQSKAEIMPRDSSKLDSLSENDKKKALNNLISIVDYKDIFPNVDLQYQVKPEQVKEDIILNKKGNNTEFVFDLKAKNVSIVLKNDNTVAFYDEKDTSKEVFSLSTPVMYDSKGIQSDKIKLSLHRSAKGYKLTVTPDNEWITNPDRVYPVTIDPDITISGTTQIQDTYVSSANPYSNYSADQIMVLRNSTSDICRAFVSFNLPQLSELSFVNQATIHSSVYNSSGWSTPVVRKVLGTWNISDITWNTQPSFSSIAEDFQLCSDHPLWDITNVVRDWYKNGNNYGVAFEITSPNVECKLESTEDPWPEPRTFATISYADNAGLESYWTYHSQDIGRAGTGYVNDATGSLTLIHNDVTTNGNRLPVNINHVFSSSDRNNTGYGYGWRLSYNQTVTPLTIGSEQYYIYSDEDGTKHYFHYYVPEGQQPYYIDESGLGRTFTKNADNTFTIADKGGNKLNFNSSGYLSTIVDNNNNTITLGYTNGKVTSATDPVGRITSLAYDTNDDLTSITEPGNKITVFDYTSGKLRKVTYPDTNYTQYNYDANNNLIEAINNDGYKIVYTYASSGQTKITKIQETHTDGTQGQSLDIAYEDNTTTYTDKTGRYNIFQFDNNGNTVCVRDKNGDAQYYDYLSGTNLNNKLSLQSKLQSSIMNYLKNHNAEASSDWTSGSQDGSTGSGIYATEAQYFGKQSLKVSKTNTNGKQYFRQQVTLTKGKDYVLSGYIKTSGISTVNSKGAVLYVTYHNNQGVEQTVMSKPINGTSDWQRNEVGFTLPTDAVSDIVNIYAAIDSESGTAYFDCLQLETGKISGRYNIVENADFSYGTTVPDSWAKYNCDASDTLVSSKDGSYSPESLSDNCFKIFGDTNFKNKEVYQNLNLSIKAGDVFTVGGWAKADSAIFSGVRTGYYTSFEIHISFLNSNNPSVAQYEYIPFNRDVRFWQYASNRVVANNDFDTVIIHLCYFNNLNIAYFDGIQLYKEEFANLYKYDANGNMTSSSDTLGQSTSYSYDIAQNLRGVRSANGVYNSLGYDSKHNLTSSNLPNI